MPFDIPLSCDRRGWLAAAGLGLSFAVPPLAARAARRRGVERPPTLVTIWLAGGPSQLETFDPHPGSPSGGPTQAIDTRLVVGAALFGVGWGLAGICPGPALMRVWLAAPGALWFVLPMLAGLLLFSRKA